MELIEEIRIIYDNYEAIGTEILAEEGPEQ